MSRQRRVRSFEMEMWGDRLAVTVNCVIQVIDFEVDFDFYGRNLGASGLGYRVVRVMTRRFFFPFLLRFSSKLRAASGADVER